MENEKRKNLIVRFLKGSIDMQEFIYEIGEDLNLMNDSMINTMLADMRNNADALATKREILSLDKEQELELLGDTYIEDKKRRLAYEVNGYRSLVVDTEIREIMKKWGMPLNQPAENYRNTSFEKLWKLLEKNPKYRAEIQQIILEIGSKEELSEELTELLDTISNKEKEIKEQDAKKEELISFMDETLQAFDSLAQIENIDEETTENVKSSLVETYTIFTERYSKLIADLANDSDVFVTNIDVKSLEYKKELAPLFKEKLEQIEKIIEQLKKKYGQFKQAEKETQNDLLSSLQGQVVSDEEYENNLANLVRNQQQLSQTEKIK